VITGDNRNYNNDDENVLTMIKAVGVDKDVTSPGLCVIRITFMAQTCAFIYIRASSQCHCFGSLSAKQYEHFRPIGLWK
jgi:hypothetical protein